MHRSVQTAAGRFAPILLLIPTLTWLGCEGNPPEEADFAGEGIFSGDMHYQTYNGGPYEARWVIPLRVDALSDTDYQCTLSGIPADVCIFQAEAPQVQIKAVLTTTYSSYTRVRTYVLSGSLEDPASSDYELNMRFTITNEYVYNSGDYAIDEFTGTTQFYRVETYDAQTAQGLKLLGNYGTFSSDYARTEVHGTSTLHEESLPGTTSEVASGLIASANVRVEDGVAYVARFSDGLRILDVHDPANITELAHAPVEDVGANYFNDVKLFHVGERRYAALADNIIGMVIYDVTDPTDPIFVSSFFPELSVYNRLNNHTLAIVGTTAYMANYNGSEMLDPQGGSGGLLIVDLSDPSHPVELGRWLATEVDGTFVHDLYVEDGVAYLCTWEAGLTLLDVHDPANPFVLGRFTYDRMTSHSVWVTRAGGRLVAVHGDEDFGSHLRVVDVDPNSGEYLQEIGALQLRPEVSIHNIMARGDKVISAWYQDGLRLVDLSDPTQPRLSSWYNTWDGMADPNNGHSFYEGIIGVDEADGKIYAMDIAKGLFVFEEGQ